MKRMPDWSAFKSKYETEALQRERFEDLARIMFCKRFNIKCGLFQYINHPGNETEPIEYDGRVIGFQAKYFKDRIAAEQIIESLEKVHRYYPNQTDQIIYTNLSFGKGKNSKKPHNQLQVEKIAKEYGISIEWVTDKMILDQCTSEDWIYDLFFNNGSGLDKLLKNEIANTNELLRSINTEILFKGNSIKITRDVIVEQIKQGIQPHQHFIIKGEGGSGKTAFVKDLKECIGSSMPFCIRKAHSLNVASIPRIISLVEYFGENDFKKAFDSNSSKVFVIDSAEKIQEFGDRNTLYSFIKLLDEEGWTLIFTTRNIFYVDLIDELKYSCKIAAQTITVDNISIDTLKNIAEQNKFKLPASTKFRERLTIPFYLSLYVNVYSEMSTSTTEKDFINLIWKEKIQGKNHARGINIRRDQCFCEIIKHRINRNCFYIKSEGLAEDALQELLNDEIVGIINNNQLFITHDIYEEWGIIRMISSAWNNKTSINEFFNEIGQSYLTRRIFRQWLSDKISENVDDIIPLINFYNVDDIPTLWRDEIIVSILNSRYCPQFLSASHTILFRDGAKLMNHVLFMLKLACRRYDSFHQINGKEYPIYVPDGLAWEHIINFLYDNRSQIISLPYILEVLYLWILNNRENKEMTYKVGILGLYLLRYKEESQESLTYYPEEYNKCLFDIICLTSPVIKNELTNLIDIIVSNKWNTSDSPYFELSTHILTNPYTAPYVSFSIPNSVRKLAFIFWTIDEQLSVTSTEDDYFQRPLYTLNKYQFGLRDEITYRNCYSPAGAFQTPIYILLQKDLFNSLQFILELVNRSTEYYLKNEGQNSLERVNVHLPDGTQIEQWGSPLLWEIYRGSSTMLTSEILQSIHMALEKFLLNLVKAGKYDLVKLMFNCILSQSKSVSLTAVVSSVVLAYPEHFSEYILSLCMTLEFFRYDNIRLLNEYQFTAFLGSAMLNKREDVAKERIESAKLSFRKESLESLCTKIQYVGVKGFSEERNNSLITAVQSILDMHYNRIKALEVEPITDSIMLHRMDRRKHNPKVIPSTNEGEFIVELRPQLPTMLKEVSDNALKTYENTYKFSSLNIWASKRFEHEDTSDIEDFDTNPHHAVESLRKLLEALNKNEELLPLDEYILFKVAAILIRDFSDKLSKEELTLCTQLIEQRIYSSLENSYIPQMSDGLELCVHAIPKLMNIFPDKIEEYKAVMSYLIKNRSAIGAYKRICDYVIESVHSNCIWQSDPEFYKELLNDVLTIKIPHTDNILVGNEIKTTIQGNLLQRFFKQFTRTKNKEKEYPPHRIINTAVSSKIDVEKNETLLELLPCGYINNEISELLKKYIVPAIIETLTDGKPNYSYNRCPYVRHYQFYNAFAAYILNCPLTSVRPLLEQIANYIKENDNIINI